MVDVITTSSYDEFGVRRGGERHFCEMGEPSIGGVDALPKGVAGGAATPDRVAVDLVIVVLGSLMNPGQQEGDLPVLKFCITRHHQTCLESAHILSDQSHNTH